MEKWEVKGEGSRVKNNRKQKVKKKKFKTKIIEYMTVKSENIVYFNDYLQEYIGARWNQVKGSLYDAGYTVTEVNIYRDKLIEEFKEICHKNNLQGII